MMCHDEKCLARGKKSEILKSTKWVEMGQLLLRQQVLNENVLLMISVGIVKNQNKMRSLL